MTLRTSAPVVVHLLRHAHSEANLKGVLAGRIEGVSLSKKGQEQALALVPTLSQLKISHIHSSPLQRCIETVSPFQRDFRSLKIKKNSAFIEMDYGSWSGRKLSTLSKQKLWNHIQSTPSVVRFPEGESFLEMRSRAIDGIENLRGIKGNHLVVSHGDVIRTILNHYLGSHIDHFQRIAIDPASISTLIFHDGNVSVRSMNAKESQRGTGHSTLGGGSGPA